MFRTSIYVVAVLAVLTLCVDSVAETIELDPEHGYASRNADLEFFEDKTKTLTIEDIRSPEISSKFVHRNWEDRVQSPESISTWIRFTLKRVNEGEDPTDWFVIIGNPYFELMEFYYPVTEGEGPSNSEMKRIVRHGNSAHPSNAVTLRLPFEGDAPTTFYLRFNHRWRDVTRLSFATISGRMSAIFGNTLYMGVFYGLMIAIAMVNLLFFLFLRDRNYLWQLLFLVSTMLFFVIDDRLILEVFPRLAPDVQWRLLAGAVAMILVWFGFFSRSFLDTRNNVPRLDKGILVFIFLSAGYIVAAPFLPLPLVSRGISGLAILVPFVALIPGFACLRKGFYPARFYLAGWIVFSITTPLAATVFMGNKWGGCILQYGIVINACLITIALVDRMRLVAKERRALEEAAVEAERQMMHAEKMVALGQLMAGVAHEINNPNNFIHFNLPIMKRYVEEMQPKLETHYREDPNLKLANMPYEMFIEDVYKLIENMHHGSTRITKIVGELKEYTHGGDEDKKEPGSIQTVVNHAVSLVGKQVKKSVKDLDVQVAPALPLVQMNAGKIEQVLVNTLINAGHAADKDESWIRVRIETEEKEQQWVHIRIQDNGSGISKEVVQKIFEPFFTTKERGVGTGLGLAISKKIIEDHDGTIEVDSGVGEGTTFTIRLPAIRD